MPSPVPNIWQLQTSSDVDGLIAALRHNEATVRKGAAAALRVLNAWQAVPALEAALRTETDWQAHAAITAALGYLDRDYHIDTMLRNKDVRGLCMMLNSARHDEIKLAAEALGNLGSKQAVESLVTVFRNPLLPSKVRLVAAESLLKLESAPGVVTLLGALRKDKWEVRRNAAAVLGQLNATWATEPLIQALGDETSLVRRTAAAALRRIGTPEAVRAASAFEMQQNKMGTQEASELAPEGFPTPEALAKLKGPDSTPDKTQPVEPPIAGKPAPPRRAEARRLLEKLLGTQALGDGAQSTSGDEVVSEAVMELTSDQRRTDIAPILGEELVVEKALLTSPPTEPLKKTDQQESPAVNPNPPSTQSGTNVLSGKVPAPEITPPPTQMSPEKPTTTDKM